jgi:hypothetical protein
MGEVSSYVQKEVFLSAAYSGPRTVFSYKPLSPGRAKRREVIDPLVAVQGPAELSVQLVEHLPRMHLYITNHQAIVGVCENSINDSSIHQFMSQCLCLDMSTGQLQTSCCQRPDLFCRSANVFNCSSSHPCLLLNSDPTTPDTSRAILAEPQM